MKSEQVKKLVFSALFAALCCVATMVIKVPTLTGGYLNLGDCFVLLSGLFLGPVYGSLAAAIGSGLADLLSGYASYVPGTFIIKGLAALAVALIFLALKKAKLNNFLAILIGGIASVAVVAGGYFVFEALFLGYGIGAAVEIPGNLLQTGVGLVLAEILYNALAKPFRRIIGSQA